jgi:hypothetical protein
VLFAYHPCYKVYITTPLQALLRCSREKHLSSLFICGVLGYNLVQRSCYAKVPLRPVSVEFHGEFHDIKCVEVTKRDNESFIECEESFILMKLH